MVRRIFTQHGQHFIGAILHAHALVTFYHSGQSVPRGVGLRIVFNDPATAFDGCQECTATQVVVGDMQLVASQQLTQVDDTLLGIRGVLALRIALNQLAEIIVGIP